MEERWSLEYLRRREMMAKLEVPTLSEANSTAGAPLAVILFEECHPELQKDFGLTPTLDGPRGDLWVSPSDLLIGKVVLKPPLTQKHTQALTHQGIIDLGVEVEQKFLNEKRIEKERALQEQEDQLQKLFAAQKVEFMAEVRKEEQLKHGQQMDNMRVYFELKVCQLLWECSEQINGVEKEMNIELNSINVLWQERLQTEIKETVKKITEEFLEKMRKQEKLLVSIFHKRIKTVLIKKKLAIDFERTKCKETIIQMKHKLHCQNISNLMYLLCKERRKCKSENNAMKNNYQTQIRKLKTDVNKKSTKIKRLLKIQSKKTKQIKVRERCLIEILRQFQKFIYFALKSAPTQGEFLLNINKLIRYELDDYCLTEQHEFRRISKTSEKPEEIVMSDYSTDMEKFLRTSETMDEEYEQSDVLPAFYFNDKIYVREDFRDIISTGIEIDATHSLWSPEVEELLNIFRKSVQGKREGCQLENVKSQPSSVHFSQGKHSSSESTTSAQLTTILPNNTPAETSPFQSIQIYPEETPTILPTAKLSPASLVQQTMKKSKSTDEEDNEEEIRKVSLAEVQKSEVKEKRKLSIKNIKNANDDFGPKKELRSSSKTASKLTLARDSVILLISNKERKSLQTISKTAQTTSKAAEEISSRSSTDKEKIVKTIKTEDIEELSDEASLIESEEFKTFGSEESEELEKTVSKHTSKLLLATDSYEIIKSTIGLLEKEKPTEKETKKSQISFGPVVEAPAGGTKSVKKQKPGKKIILKKHATGKPTVRSTPRSVAKVVGSPKIKEHEQTVDEFTDERIKSLVNMMKESPSLIRLFTSCHK